MERSYAVVLMDLTMVLIPCGSCVFALKVVLVLSRNICVCPLLSCDAMNILNLVVRVSRTVVADMLFLVFRTSIALFGPIPVDVNSREHVAS